MDSDTPKSAAGGAASGAKGRSAGKPAATVRLARGAAASGGAAKAGSAKTGQARAGGGGKKAAGKPAAAATLPVKGGTLRKKELVDRVVAASGARKNDARDIVEAVLKVLGEALAGGEALALPPLGKAKVNRQKDTAGGEIMVVKLRRPGPAKTPVSADETLAEPVE